MWHVCCTKKREAPSRIDQASPSSTETHQGLDTHILGKGLLVERGLSDFLPGALMLCIDGSILEHSSKEGTLFLLWCVAKL